MSPLFLVAAALAVAGAAGVVLARPPVHGVLALVVNFIGLATLYLSLQAEFMAVVQIIIYAGAVMILFLFVIALLTVRREGGEQPASPLPGQRAAGVATAAALAGLLGAAALRFGFGGAGPVAARPVDELFGGVVAFGRSLLSAQLFPFELAALVLVAAVVGVVVLVGRGDAA